MVGTNTLVYGWGDQSTDHDASVQKRVRGLGLPICKQLAVAMGGDCRLFDRREPGCGVVTVFELMVPLAIAPEVCPLCGLLPGVWYHADLLLSVRLYVCASVCLCLWLCLWLWLPPPVCASVCLCFCVPVSVSVAVAVAATAACLCVCMSVLLCAGVCVCGCGCHRLSVRLYVCARVSHLPRMDCCGRIRWTMCLWVGARWGRLVGVRSHWYTQPSV